MTLGSKHVDERVDESDFLGVCSGVLGVILYLVSDVGS